MLAIVKQPRIEISLSGSPKAVRKMVKFLRSRYSISVLSENTEQPAPNTSENAGENTFWGLNITPGDQLRGFRLQHNLSQAQLAKMTGIGQTVISAYETGRRPLTRRAAVRIGAALGEDPEKILFAPELEENR